MPKSNALSYNHNLMKPYEKFLDFIIYGSNLYGKKI
jgi:hypothetical protein